MEIIFSLIFILGGILMVIKNEKVAKWWYKYMTWKILPEKFNRVGVVMFGIFIILMGIAMLGPQLF